MINRYVVARHCSGGIGDHLSCLVGAWWLAKRTDRTLVVDWRGSRFNPDPSMAKNCFHSYFRQTSTLAGVPLVADDSVAHKSYPLPIWPEKWSGRALAAADHVRHTSEEIISVNSLVTSEDDRPEPTIALNQWIETAAPPEAVSTLLRELVPLDSIRSESDAFWRTNIGDAPAIAIHIRHGNGENLGDRSAYWLGPISLIKQLSVNARNDVHRDVVGGRFLDNMPDSLIGTQAKAEMRLCREIREQFNKLAGDCGLHNAVPVVFSDAPHIFDLIRGIMPNAVSQQKTLMQKGAGPLHQISQGGATISQNITQEMFVELDIMKRCHAILYMDSGFSILARSALDEKHKRRLRPPLTNRIVSKVAGLLFWVSSGPAANSHNKMDRS